MWALVAVAAMVALPAEGHSRAPDASHPGPLLGAPASPAAGPAPSTRGAPRIAQAPPAPAGPAVAPPTDRPHPAPEAAPIGGCSDPTLLKAAHNSDTAKGIKEIQDYLISTDAACRPAARDVLKDLLRWAAIEAAAGSGPGQRRAGSPPPQRPESQEQSRLQLLKLLEDYLNPEILAKPLREKPAREMLERLKKEMLTARCDAYGKAALRQREAYLKEGCQIGQTKAEEDLWINNSSFHHSLCVDRNGPDGVQQLAADREKALARCRRAKAEATAFAEVQKAGKDRKRLIPAAERYVKEHGEDGTNREVVKGLLDEARQAQKREQCQGFVSQALALAKRKEEDPACTMTGDPWSTDDKVHLKWCLEAPDGQAAIEGRKRAEAIDQCTRPRRDDEAWRAVEREAAIDRKIEAARRYLDAWPGGRHEAEADALLKKLCEARWPEAARGTSWSALSVYVDGACSGTSRSAEALQRREAFDRAEWQKAKAANSKAGYQNYINRTGSGAEKLGEATDAVFDFSDWERATQQGATCATVWAYVQKHPQGRYAASARARLKQLVDADRAKARANPNHWRQCADYE